VRQGKSVSHYRRPIYEQHYRVTARRLQPGQACELRAEMAIPPGAIPSQSEHHRRIEWTVTLDAPTEGLSANVREKVSLTVGPNLRERGHADDPHVPVRWVASAPIMDGHAGRITLGGVQGSSGEQLRGISVIGEGFVASLEVTDGVVSDYGPVLAAGTTRELKLIVEAQEALHCRGLRVWIGCRLGGHGSTEKIELFHEDSVWAGELAAGQRIETPIRIVVPRHGPVTYVGEHVRFDWLVRLRVDVPLWRDRVAELPFVVVPQAVQA